MNGVTWRYDLNAMSYICSDGRFVTDQALFDYPDQDAAKMLRQALKEACSK